MESKPKSPMQASFKKPVMLDLNQFSEKVNKPTGVFHGVNRDPFQLLMPNSP